MSDTSSLSNLSLKVRLSGDRGAGDHGWLNSYHTFSFADYYDSDYPGFGELRVINEDRVSGGNGFGKHSHSNFEIFSYIVQGQLKHNDSMGNEEILSRGDVQFTSAGKGIQHSEYNANQKDMVHFIQMWVKPQKRGITPSYQTHHWSDQQKEGKLTLLISPTGEQDTIKINNEVKVYAAILDSQQSVTFNIAPHRQAYIHLIMNVTGMHSEEHVTDLLLNASNDQATLHAGDGVFISLKNADLPGELMITGITKGNRKAEFILFDLPRE